MAGSPVSFPSKIFGSTDRCITCTIFWENVALMSIKRIELTSMKKVSACNEVTFAQGNFVETVEAL